LLPLEETAAAGALRAERHLAHAYRALVDEDVEDAGLAEVEEGREQRHARRRRAAARALHRQRGREDRPADAEAERVDLLLAGDLANDGQRAQDAAVDVVVPGALGDLLAGVLP